MAYKSILTAVDSSKESEKAFARALAMAIEDGAKLTLTHVVDIPTHSDYRQYDATIMELAKESATEMLDEFKAKAAEQGLDNLEYILEFGSAKREIVKTIIPKVSPDLVIVGATGTNALERVLVGSVSDYIIRHAPCDVLVIRN